MDYKLQPYRERDYQLERTDSQCILQTIIQFTVAENYETLNAFYEQQPKV